MRSGELAGYLKSVGIFNNHSHPSMMRGFGVLGFWGLGFRV